FHHCAGDPKKHDEPKRLVGNVVWGGIDLAELLETVGVRPEARYLWAFGLDRGRYEGLGGDNYQKDMPIARLAEGDVLLAYECNGESLTVEHGYPLRLVIPGYYGTNDVKWLCRLELADRRAGGVFTTTLYNDPDGATGARRALWEAPPESLIVSPSADARLSREPVEIWGWAWAARGVDRVEISADGGATWSQAALEPRSQYSWQRFSRAWTPSATGACEIVARATDTLGKVQPMSRARNAVHAVPVEVTSG
ncbi:MAG: molybdopterin-dependent oxidoreductase, partial [Stellaceae bacterium]